MAGADDDFLGYLHTMWEENNEKMVCTCVSREEMDDICSQLELGEDQSRFY